MSERLYKEQVKEITNKRNEFNTSLSELKLKLVNKPSLSLEELVAGAQEMLRNLDLTDKKAIVRKIIDKVVATQKETVIWGHIQILTKEQVGLYAADRHRQLATMPFTISFEMPPLDKRTRGYLPKYIQELQATVGGEW